MNLNQLVELIEQERQLAVRINAELAKWTNPSGQRCTELRAIRRLAVSTSQREAAKALGITALHLRNLERGKCKPGRELMVRLHALLKAGAQ